MSNMTGFEALTVSTAAVSVTPGTITPLVRSALFIVTKAAVRYRGDGTAPTASTGAPLWPGQVLPLVGKGTIRNAQFIRQDSTDAVVYCLAYDMVDIVGPISNGGLYEDNVAFTPGSPVSVIGALADDTSPDSVDEADTGAVAMSLQRELYVRPSRRGASEVKVISVSSVSDSSARVDMVEPTSGKAIRVIAVYAWTTNTTAHRVHFYFGDGVTEQSARAKIVYGAVIDFDFMPNMQMVFPDGAGPVGAINEALSVRTSANIETYNEFFVVYREE